MFSISTTLKNVKVYYNGRLQFVTSDTNKALHYISIHYYKEV